MRFQKLAEELFFHNAELPLLITIVHSQFETIHPFLDGNGRSGAFSCFPAYERRILQKPVLYLSHYFKRHRESVKAVRERGDWEGWLKFFLSGVIEVSGEAAETARSILSLREEHRTAINEPGKLRRKRPSLAGISI